MENFSVFISSEFGLLMQSDFALTVMMQEFSGTSVMGFNLRRESLISLK